MITVLEQDSILTTIRNQHLRDQLHHSWFFQGEPGVGKLETALWFAQGHFCEKRDTFLQSDNSNFSQIACGECRSCLDVEFYRHPQILLLTTGDRLPLISYLQQALLSQNCDPPDKVIYQLSREIHQLLGRHRQKLLDSVSREKTTYQEGVKLSAEEVEKLIHKIYLQYREVLHGPKHTREIPAILAGTEFLEDMKKLQNSLDRSVLTKENLDRVMGWCKHNDGNRKLVIIENIELINNNVVGLFLKILEDPPPQVSFILITEDMDNLNQEVTLPLLSRCLHFSFQPLTGKIDDILRRRFHIETGFINQESSFHSFFQKHVFTDGSYSLDFLLQPIYKITGKITDKNFREESIVSNLYSLMGEYARSRSGPVKVNYRQALSIIRFVDQNYPLVKKNNYSKTNFIVELSLFIKKTLQRTPTL